MTTTEIKGEVSEETTDREFGIEFNVEDLKAIFKALEHLVEEVKVSFNKYGLLVRAVDPAHVCMIDLSLDESALNFYLLEGVDNIGLDLDKVKSILKMAKKGDVIRFDLVGKALAYHVGNQTGQISLVDTGGMSDPKVPNLNLSTKFRMNTQDILDFIKRGNEVSDHIKIEVQDGKVILSCEGDTDKAEMTLPIDHEGGTCNSLYSLEYLENVIKGIKGVSKEITISMGTNYPIKIEYKGCNDKGTFLVLLAPRLENGGR